MADPAQPDADISHRYQRALRPLYALEARLEAPMFLLALAWLWLFMVELVQGLTPRQQLWVTLIWAAFILEFVVKLTVAPRRWRYLKRNKLTLLALLIPALRTFRLLRAIRLLRTARVITTTRYVRALSSTRRLLTDLQEAQGQRSEPEMNLGVLIAHSPSGDAARMHEFARQLLMDVSPELERASGIPWIAHEAHEMRLTRESPHQPAEFLAEASRRMAHGPFDAVIVVTDVPLVSRHQRPEYGLASAVSRTVVLSLDNLIEDGRAERRRDPKSAAVRWNAAALLLHLLGHMAGLRHYGRGESEVMAPLVFRETRRSLPQFNTGEVRRLRRAAGELPERELRGGGTLASLLFHILMAFRHPLQVLRPLLRSGPLLLPFSLPSLSTAAVAPALILVFSAETWDVGLNMNNTTALVFASASVIGASFYLVMIQSLFFPRKEKETVTEHLAVANSVVFLSMLLACIGLFLLVAVLMLAIQFYVFPPDLMRTWPTLDDPRITLIDQLRLSSFISTIGTATGALAGGLESRAVIQHLALFNDTP